MKALIAAALVSFSLGVGALESAGQAVNLVAGPVRVHSQNCDRGGQAFADVMWEASNAGEQWLDISLFAGGFAPGTFIGIGPLEADRVGFLLTGMVPNRTHYVRVNTLTSEGWVSGTWSSFLTLDCAGAGPARLEDGGTVGCEQGQLLGVFSWTPAASGEVQWLDLTTQNNGFAAGTFISAGPLNRDLATYQWRGLSSYTTHYWRINTWTGSQWLTSATGSFRTRIILSDGNCPHIV